jgi:hypothetical protein
MKKAFCMVGTFSAGDGGQTLRFADSEDEACDQFRRDRPDTVSVRAIELSLPHASSMLNIKRSEIPYMRKRLIESEHPNLPVILAMLDVAEEALHKAHEAFCKL